MDSECGRCGYYIDTEWDSYYDNAEYDMVCYECHRALRSLETAARRRNVWNLERGETRECNTFGVEIETEFNDYCPFDLNGYHDDCGGDYRFFDDWRSEDDCSLRDGRSAEIISPILTDASGIAEIIATFSILQDHDAVMNRRCGQHTSVMTKGGDRREQQKVVRVTAALEEALLAVTGSYSRWNGNNSYSPTVKGSGRNESFEEENFWGGGNANPRGGGRIEFRYPPGTLVASQMAMNVGMCQMMVDKAHELTFSETSDLAREALSIQRRYTPDTNYYSRPNSDGLHALVKFGFSLLADFGWGDGGSMPGLPYNPDNTPRYTTSERGGYDVRLPGRNRISNRIERQVRRFYNRIQESNNPVADMTSDELAEETLGILHHQGALLV